MRKTNKPVLLVISLIISFLANAATGQDDFSDNFYRGKIMSDQIESTRIERERMEMQNRLYELRMEMKLRDLEGQRLESEKQGSASSASPQTKPPDARSCEADCIKLHKDGQLNERTGVDACIKTLCDQK